MPGESLSFDILAHDHASREIKNVGQAAAGTAAKLDVAAASMALFDETTQKAGKAAGTSQAAFKSHAKATALLADSERVLAGEATKTTKLLADQGNEAEKTAKQMGSLAGSGGGGIPGGGIGALIAAGVGLSPVLATLAFGLAGLGAAAVGVLKPILDASQATGGLKANLGSLDPAQQAAAKSLLGLEASYQGFEKALAPVVLKDFNAAIAQAGPLMKDLEPVAQATGKGLAQLIGQIGGVFKSGQWQQFFGFMAKEAAPDLQQLGTAFASFAKGLPGIVEGLKPTSDALLNIIGEVGQLTNALGTGSQAIDRAGHSASGTANAFGHVSDFFKGLGINVITLGGAFVAGQVEKHLNDTGKAAADAADGTQHLSAAQIAAAAAAQQQKAAVADLTGALNGQVNALLAAQGNEVAWKQAQQQATQALNANKNALDGNSASALAARQALIQSSNAALTAAQSQITLHHNVSAASAILNNQIAYLATHAGHSRVAAEEVAALVAAENRIPGHVTSTIHASTAAAAAALARVLNQMNALNGKTSTVFVDYSVNGQSFVVPHHRHVASGGLIPGAGNSDSVPAILTPGEVVVPKGMVQAGAVDHLRGSLPGFAAGGKVPLSRRVSEALHDVRSHPGHPGEIHRLTGTLASTRGHIHADRELLAHGHLSAEQRRRAQAGLRGELSHQARLLHELRPLRRERNQVQGVASDLAGHDAALRSAAAAAERRHLTKAASRLRHQLGTGQSHEKTLTNWLDKVQISAAAAARRKQAQQAAAAKAAAASAAAAAAVAAVQANDTTITSYLSRFEPGLSGGALGAAGAALGFAPIAAAGSVPGGVVPGGVVKFDQGGWLKPGLTLALNQTGRPEPVGARARGGTYNITVNAGVGSHPAEIGRQVVSAIREFEKRSGSSWRN